MADLKEFDIVRVARSDGADTGPGYWPSSSTPAAKKAAADATTTAEKTATRTKPQMARLTEDDPRFVEWRVKLGILLKQELSPNPEEGNAWYVEFPRGYWLYEKSKHLWVSGYPVKAKLFKTPQEFALHLIWLLSSSKDYMDCACVHCNAANIAKITAATEEVLNITSQDSAATKAEKTPSKVTPVPLPPMPRQGLQRPPSTAPQAQTAKPPPPEKSVTPLPPPVITPPPHQQQQQQAPQQAIAWSLTSPMLFRVGELVWYNTGSSWRLGVIVAAHPQGRSFELMPISHGLLRQPHVSKTDGDMRPFQAFSVPPATIPELNDKMFDEVPWETNFNNLPDKREVLALDASKLAALKIDYSFSLWSALSDTPPGDMVGYYGCFLGAERIEIGDSLRVRAPPELNIEGNAILGLLYIYTLASNPGVVFFRGNLYVPRPVEASAADPALDDAVPVALREEAQFRNQFNPPQRLQWVLVKENLTVAEDAVRGRFYPTPRIVPLLDPAGFKNAMAQGKLENLFVQLNNRMDGAGRYIGRAKNRIQTLGTAVAHGSSIMTEDHINEETFGGP